MKRQLQVVVALAVFGVAMLAASAVAGGIKLGLGTGEVSIDLPGGANLEPLGVLPACSNLKDDDGDGKVDLADPGCSGPLDNDESNPAPTNPPQTPTDPGSPGGGKGGGKGGGGGGYNPDPGSGNAGPGGGKGKGNVKQDSDDKEVNKNREPTAPPEARNPDGTPTKSNPTTTFADFGAAPIGVPNFVIDQFSIPPFLLPIYQACGTEYGVPWQVLAAINKVETAFGTNLNVSTAGALGWMQFMPPSWEAYGVDANNDGRKDPYNPVDAICAAGNYLQAHGAEDDLPRAVFAYNHADWYVDMVLTQARQYGKLPNDLIGSLTGLTEGARFPVAANARYADDISEREALRRAKPTKGSAGNVADVISASPTRRGINIYSRDDAPVIAVNDGVIKKIGKSKELGKFLILEDAYGNRFTYAKLGSIAEVYPVPERRNLDASDFKLVKPGSDAKSSIAASSTKRSGQTRKLAGLKAASSKADQGPVNTEDSRERLYAFPERDANVGRADLTGQLDSLMTRRFPGYENFKGYLSGVLRFNQKTMDTAALHEGSKVVAGTVLGRIGKTSKLAPHLNFAIKPTGRGAPSIDPKPILDGWKLLEATAIYRAAGKNPFAKSGASIGQVLLMSKEQLVKRALNDPRLEVYSCGRSDIQTGQIDRRVLAMLQYLTQSGYRLTVTSLKCGHSVYTTGGSISHHSSGNAVDIAQINGLPVIGNQGPGSITEALVRDIMQLQGTMAPSQVISLMDFGGASFAMGDHADHVHVGYTPSYGPRSADDKQFIQLLEPEQWKRLIDRIASIENPDVPTSPSRFAIPTKKKGQKNAGRGRASSSHIGE